MPISNNKILVFIPMKRNGRCVELLDYHTVAIGWVRAFWIHSFRFSHSYFSVDLKFWINHSTIFVEISFFTITSQLHPIIPIPKSRNFPNWNEMTALDNNNKCNEQNQNKKKSSFTNSIANTPFLEGMYWQLTALTNQCCGILFAFYLP